MALGFTRSSGDQDFLPVFKLNAVSGDIVIASSKKNESTGDWDKVESDVKLPSKFVFDFENIEVGWMLFSATGPNFAVVRLGSPLPARPTPEHKQGFRVKLYNKEHGVSVFSNSSRTVAEVMDVLHDQYLCEEKNHAGKVPVVEIKGMKKVQVKTKEGSKSYKQPEWSIVSWAPRPEALVEKKVEEVKEEEVSGDDDF